MHARTRRTELTCVMGGVPTSLEGALVYKRRCARRVQRTDDMGGTIRGWIVVGRSGVQGHGSWYTGRRVSMSSHGRASFR